MMASTSTPMPEPLAGESPDTFRVRLRAWFDATEPAGVLTAGLRDAEWDYLCSLAGIDPGPGGDGSGGLVPVVDRGAPLTAAQTDDTTMEASMPAAPKPDTDDCPKGQHRDDMSGDCVPDEDDADYSALAGQDGEHFHTWVTEGVSTGFRSFAADAITWREPPFAYHEQVDSSAHGGTARTVQRGIVTRAERDGDTIHFYGRLDLRSPDTLDYARRLAEGYATWSSVGPDESVRGSAIEFVWPAQTDGDGDGEHVVDMLMGAEPEAMIFHSYNVAEISAVSVPALADARVEPTQALLDELAALGVLAASNAERSDEPIVAAGYTIEIPDCPPAAWFDEPTDVTAHGALTITDEGRIYGYLAPDGVAHRSFPGQRVTVPMGRVDYERWMGGEAIVADGGRVVAGPITMECGHLPPSAASESVIRMQHYDNACSVVAKARIGENRHGVWIAGALEPGVTADQVSRMLACRLSGDWAPHPERPGWREFVAALVVPVPGFPQARTAPSVRFADGALVASAVPVRVVHAGDDVCTDDSGCDLDLRPVLERIAVGIGRDTRSRMGGLRERVHSGERMSVDVY